MLKKRGASTATLIGALIVGLLIGAGIVYGAAPSLGLGSNTTKTSTVTGAGSTVTTTVGAGATVTSTVTGPTSTVTNSVTTTISGAGGGLCNGQTVTIGALNDLSGALSAQGKGDLAAEQLAITDVNSYVASAGCNLKFALNANDYKLDTPTALNQLTAMAAAGVQIVVGPLNSGTAAGILAYANSNHIVLLSPSSTSAGLAIPGDYLFRTAPADSAQGKADARILTERGAQAVIIINRDDTYGNGLANSTKVSLLKDNPSVVIKGPYKYDITTTDFTALLTQINTDYNALNTGAMTGHVAIYVVSFQELGTLLIQANNNPTFKPLLSTPLPWFGDDGQAQNSLLTNATGSGPEMAKIRLPSTLFNVQNNSRTFDFYARLNDPANAAAKTAILGGGAFYTFEGYDDVWLAALSILSAGSNSGTAIHSVLPTVAANFYGLTGWEGLDVNGDRIPGSYNVWKVVSVGSAFNWVLAGIWDYSTDTVTWSNAP
jgi:branched-chain amino acid transport system substrate-binding protein